MNDSTGSRVPNGWGDPSTERHLQVPPRHATGSRAAKLHPLDSCPVPGGCIRCWSIGPHATPDRAAKWAVVDKVNGRQLGPVFDREGDATEYLWRDLPHPHLAKVVEK